MPDAFGSPSCLDRSAESLCGFVESAVSPGSLIVTDDWSGYAGLGKRGYEHFAVAECGDPEVAEQYLPISHLVFANLKTWLIGIHHGVSHQHLQACLNEFTFRFNRRFYPFNAFRSLLGIAGDTSAPTYAELYSGVWRHPTCSVMGVNIHAGIGKIVSIICFGDYDMNISLIVHGRDFYYPSLPAHVSNYLG